MYRPKEIDILRTPAKVYRRKKTNINGSFKFKDEPINDNIIMCNFKSYGGTEREVNGVYTIIDTATVTTWYRPDITSDCIIELEDGRKYEIKNEPEDFGLQHQYMQFKVERLKPNG